MIAELSRTGKELSTSMYCNQLLCIAIQGELNQSKAQRLKQHTILKLKQVFLSANLPKFVHNSAGRFQLYWSVSTLLHKAKT